MTQREPKIADCPFCGGECRTGEYLCHPCWTNGAHHVSCSECGYCSGLHPSPPAAIAAHNAVARRLDPARVLRVVGGMKGQWLRFPWVPHGDYSGFWSCGAQDTFDAILAKIRAMKEPTP